MMTALTRQVLMNSINHLAISWRDNTSQVHSSDYR
jgi:hypothetical protein